MLYFIYDGYKKMLAPFVDSLEFGTVILEPLREINPVNNLLYAQTQWLHDLLKENPEPEFKINQLEYENELYPVKEQIILEKTFCNLVNFEVVGREKKPILLIVIPLSGHYPILLKDTIKRSLDDFDVYITDWKNCRDIPLEEGDFGFNDYVHYLVDFFKYLKRIDKDFSAMGVCQPTVPLMVATAYLEETNKKILPKNVILMGGPIDTRISPTQVNDYALNKDLSWFKQHVIHTVPNRFEGFGRLVYPGFLQHSGFIAMNRKRHTQAHMDFFNHLMEGAELDIKKHRDFYDEYNAVMDLPAAYYLETLANVFIDQKLPKKLLEIDGVKIDLEKISSVKLLTIEGELDDISGPGQTHAAYDLCKGIKTNKKEKITIPKVGHYGIFAGRTWRDVIYPTVKEFILNI